jgi:hypothetical protein
MRKVLEAGQALLSLSPLEQSAICKLMKLACSTNQHSGSEFKARYSVSREEMLGMLEVLTSPPHESLRSNEVVNVWADQGSVMVRVMSTSGDPVEMGETEALQFAAQLRQAIQEAL